MWGTALTLAGGLVSPAIDAFRGSSKAEKAYERFLKSKGLSDAEIREQVSQVAGVQADKADLTKTGITANLQNQGLGSSIIGTQAGLQVDKDKNQFIADRMSQLYNKNIAEKLKRDEMLANYRLDRDQAKRQGQADFWGGLSSGFGSILSSNGGKNILTDWLNKSRS